MSCQLFVFANFQDIKSVKKYLFPSKEDHSESEATETWDDSDWGWNIESKDTIEHKNDILGWLQECQVSISPVAELMALAYKDKIVILSQKYNSDDEEIQKRYTLCYEGCLRQEENETITSVLCLPLSSQKRSSQGGPDWTCVVVGFSSGYVRMYTENGTLLFSQIFSEEAVVNFKCKTYEPPRHSEQAEKLEELSILYRKSLVTVDGFSLFQSLRACRNQVARAAASGSDWIQPPPLAYKKWALLDQDQATDQVSCGTIVPNAFDQMVNASMAGFTSSFRPSAPASHVHLTTGRGPYAGVYYIVEGSTQPMLSDVAHAMASKLKSALFSQISAASGWLGMGGKQTSDNSREKKKPKIEPATSVSARFGLHDKRRQGETIVLSPNSKLAATTDSFGRVILLDVFQGIAVRIWKGYRDAQVGWIEVKEDASSGRENINKNPLRRAIFLVIYAPKRGILEIWTAQQGPRVAAFNVSKWGQLICPSYGVMGLNNVTYKEARVPCNQMYFVDPDGVVKILEVPFHLALSDKNSKRARDMHLLKKLKTTLKENEVESSGLEHDVIDLLLDIKTASIRHQGLERVLVCKYLSANVLDTVLKAVMKHIETQVDVDSNVNDNEFEGLAFDSKLLLHFCKAEEHLLKTYTTMCSCNADESTVPQDHVENFDEKLGKILSLTPEEIMQLKNEINLYEKTFKDTSHIKFLSDYSMSAVDFISCFECERNKSDECTVNTVRVYRAISEGKKSKLAYFLFNEALHKGTKSEYNQLLKDSHISPEDLMNLLLYLWLNEKRKDLGSIGNLCSVVKSISCIKNDFEAFEKCNEVSQWWQFIRDQLTASQYLSSALLMALVCKSVAMQLGNASLTEDLLMEVNDVANNMNNSNEWEAITIDKTQWTIFVKQLEDLLVLQCLLKMKPQDYGLVSKTEWDWEPISVTVKRVIDGGRGVLPEFVAKWIAGNGIPPSVLCLTQNDAVVTFSRQSSAVDSSKTKDLIKSESCDSSSQENPIVAQLQAVQARLPYSLDSDILMVNCAWEYMVLWNKDAEIILPLELGLSYLRCIQNATLQHGVSVMMWQMFILKKFSSTALLIEKVGKAPKDRLCRKDVGLSEVSLEKFMKLSIELLDLIIQSQEDYGDIPRFNVEDLWQHVQGPSSLVELALEQKESTLQLIHHHYNLGAVMYAILSFGMKSIKPLSLFDSKGRNAFFKPLSMIPTLPKMVDDSLLHARKQFLNRVITHAVVSLNDATTSTSQSSSPLYKRKMNIPHSSQYTLWPNLCKRVGREIGVEVDDLLRHQCCELYSNGYDKLAEEVLLSIKNHAVIGSQLLVLAGKRLHHFIYVSDPSHSVDKIAMCSTLASTWLKSLDSNQLKCTNPPLQDTATLIGHVVNQLPEGHSEYKLAIELVQLVQYFV